MRPRASTRPRCGFFPLAVTLLGAALLGTALLAMSAVTSVARYMQGGSTDLTPMFTAVGGSGYGAYTSYMHPGGTYLGR
jgi:hypothetical protein